jgi:hypothetical protein
MIITIATKGRPQTKSYLHYQKFDIPVFHFVEPQDEAAYVAAKVPNLVVIPDNNRGLWYVRNFILEWARKSNHKWIWMNDDDVKGFGIATKGKTVNQDANVLIDIYKMVEPYKYPASGLNYCQHAWSYCKRPRYFVNKRPPDVCSLYYVPAIHWEFRESMNTKVDRDFYMQCIQGGKGIIISTHHWFACPDVGSNAGGLNAEYASKRDNDAAVVLRDAWAPYAELIKKGERVDCKLFFAEYARSLGRTVRP